MMKENTSSLPRSVLTLTHLRANQSPNGSTDGPAQNWNLKQFGIFEYRLEQFGIFEYRLELGTQIGNTNRDACYNTRSHQNNTKHQGSPVEQQSSTRCYCIAATT
jgi:hypothetical protein